MEDTTKLIKLDLGCGGNKITPDHIGVDQYEMKGVDVVCNLASEWWPWEDGTVDEVHSAHFLEHLTNLNEKWERVHFFNELYRVLKDGAKATLIFPHWCSTRYYGDPTHKEPFSEMGFYYLSREWRASQAPHTDIEWNKNGYDCDFECQWGYNPHAALATRNQEYVQNAFSWYKESIQDIVATLAKKPKM